MSADKPAAAVTTIGVQVPADLAEKLREKAQASDRSLSAEVRRAIRAHLNVEQEAA